jgi:hypothetical protein
MRVRVNDMIDLQQFLVADHIAQLDDEAAALRAERRQRHRGSGAAGARRVRIGRWLVGVGLAIAGEDHQSLPNAA